MNTDYIEGQLFADKHSRNLLHLLEDVVLLKRDEVKGIPKASQDVLFAIEMSKRIDEAVVLPGVLEILDGPVVFLGCLAVVGIWRAIQNRDKIRGNRIRRLRERLEMRGPKMLKDRRRRLEKRIERLESK